MADGRRNNGGHSTKGRAGRPSKAKETRVSTKAIEAIEKEFGSQEEFWKFVAEKAKDSRDHFQALVQYAYGKPQEKVDHTTQGEQVNEIQVKLVSSRDRNE